MSERASVSVFLLEGAYIITKVFGIEQNFNI